MTVNFSARARGGRVALHWGPKGIRVNAILPGLVKTDFAKALWEDPERLERIENKTPLRRIGQPDDIAGVAHFLASDASAYVNNDATGLNDVAPYPLYPGIHSMAAMQFTLTREKWDALSPEDQTALRDWWYMAMEDLARVVHEEDEKLAARDRQGDRIEVIDWAQEDRDQLREVARAEWEAYAEKSDLAGEVLQAHLDYMKSIGLLK